MDNSSQNTAKEQKKGFSEWQEKLSATMRAVGSNSKLTLNFKDQNYQEEENSISLPQALNQDKEQLARAYADKFAAFHRYHDKYLHVKLCEKYKVGEAYFAPAEQARIEALASINYPGINKNLTSFDNALAAKSSENLKFTDAVYWLLKEKLAKKEIPKQLTKKLSPWRKLLEGELQKINDKLFDSLNNQEEFAKQFRRLLINWQQEVGEELAPPDQQDQEQDSTSQDASQEENNSDETSDAQSPENQQSNETGNEDDGDNISQSDEKQKNLSEQIKAFESDQMLESWWQDATDVINQRVDYKVYTSEYDKTLKARDLVDNKRIAELRKNLDKDFKAHKRTLLQLSAKLTRLLQSQQLRWWNFDKEEGFLDTTKLTKLITNPTQSFAFKQEALTNFPDTVISMLIDNSGSMRGRPIHLAAICADILAATFDKSGVKFEVLGYTTARWKGGKSREKWIKNGGKPDKPGRLNDLLHIIYKSADEGFRSSKNAIAAMLHEDILKENIDGEAITWALKRLKMRNEKRKILIVISDGAPVDDATLNAMGGNYLEQHLKQTVRDAESIENVEIFAIGIGHNVSRYFQHAIWIKDAESLSETLINELVLLFSNKAARKK